MCVTERDFMIALGEESCNHCDAVLNIKIRPLRHVRYSLARHAGSSLALCCSQRVVIITSAAC